ncbi:GH92 family glycosyl hydrolase [Gordonia sp. CPCC 205333]|uniref:GH92 family glycosyl hydrolase n=1 Tax=Gordonia sp. CPCC 205333 TaxID=3140790 RepID=UPI003AF35CCD
MSSTRATLNRSDGPAHPVNAKPGVGFTSMRPWCYDVSGRAGELVRLTIESTGLEGVTIAPGMRISYVVHPVFDATELDVRDSYAATSVCLDIVFADRSRLSATDIVDQHGVPATPGAQYDSKSIAVDQWTRKSFPLNSFVGATIDSVELTVLIPASVVGASARRRLIGYLDSIRVDSAARTPVDILDHVRTTRGTQSSDRFSRGNCAPLVAGGPHPFVFGLPMTDGGNRGWPYSYHEASRVDSRVRPHLQSFATSHIPSPWMGDRGVFQFFPSPSAYPDPSREARALAFDHDTEYDRPHLYAVTLDVGDGQTLTAELTAGTHSVWLRVTYPKATGDGAAISVGSIIFDQFDADGALMLSASAITGYVDGPGGMVRVPRMYVYAEVDSKVIDTHTYPDSDRAAVLGSITVDAAAGPVTLAVGTSFIGVDQARRNLELDRAGGTFDDVVRRARQRWLDALSVLDVDGASADQLTTLYSSLYRLNLYPTTAAENRGDVAQPDWCYATPFGDLAEPDQATRTGRAIVDGRLTVTDGFWDSYRTSWPLRTLLSPNKTAELLNGFVEHYRSGGWVSRWSAPGPADIMTGTSSDAVFADAALAGLGERGFDIFEAYDSCLRNATTPSDDPRVGRKGIDRSLFTGYADTRIHEGMSWTVDAAINDAAIAAFSGYLGRRYPGHPRHTEFVTNATWFTARAGRYAVMFDTETGFFRGREPDGSWRDESFDPRRWGTDYTETNAWGSAFTAPQDGAGLAALHGGNAPLEARLDTFYALAESGREEFRGGYPVIIHEMREARDTRMGMLALSNQPAHHIPYMYAFASRAGSRAHAKTQRIVTESVRRLFLGSEVGQGYPGDEDNGEMSAWYLWAASGLYPLTIGSGQYVLCAPSFRRMSWRLENGSVIDIVAPDADRHNIYIQAVRINGEPWSEIVVDRARLVHGARIDFELGPQPSEWAASSTPPSITALGEFPFFPADLTSPENAQRSASGGENAANAFDDDSSTPGAVLAPNEFVAWSFDEPTRISHYTITPKVAGALAWNVEVLDAQDRWQEVSTGRAEFRWERQTRVFAVGDLPEVLGVRIRVDRAATVVQLEWLELRHQTMPSSTASAECRPASSKGQ